MSIPSNKLCALFFLSVFLFFNTSVFAEVKIQNLVLNADEIDRDLTEKSITLNGHVFIKLGDQSVAADKATIYLEKKQLIASGLVILKTPSFFAQGHDFEYNYESKTGVFKNGYIQSGQVIFEGDRIEKVGEKEFIATNASYTACASCPPAWSFSGSKIEAEIGGYAYIKFPVLRLVNVPVFVLPGILVPLKSERQSGLLVPSWEDSDDGGFTFSESYFWAIPRSTDATFTATHYKKRGLKLLGEYRFILDKNSQGEFRAGALTDKVFAGEADTKNNNRWFTKYTHIFSMPENYTQKVKLNLVSDLRYPRDFPKEIEGYGDPALENRVSISKSNESNFASIEVDYYINLLNQSANTDNSEAVHRMPEIHYSLIDRQLKNSGFYFKMDNEFVNFFRSGYSFDDVNLADGSVNSDQNDGVFDPNTDIIRTGTRIDLKPTISYPFHVGNYLQVLPSLTYRQTYYTFYASSTDPDYSDKTFRQYIQTDLTVSTELSKIYEGFSFFEDSENTKTLYKHKIEPQLTYSNIPEKSSQDHKFFGDFQNNRADSVDAPIIDSDFWADGQLGQGKVQFDYNDRLFNYHVAKLGIINRIIRKRWQSGQPHYKNIATFSAFQFYDLNEKNRNTTVQRPLSPLDLLLDLRLDRFETNTTARYHPYAHVTDFSSRLKFLDDLGNYFQISYNRTNKISSDFVLIPEELSETTGLGIGYASKVFNLYGEIKFSHVTNDIQSWKYMTEIKPTGSCWSILFGQEQVFQKKGRTTNLNVSFDFGGKG